LFLQRLFIFVALFALIECVSGKASRANSASFLWAIAILYLFNFIACILPGMAIFIINNIRNFACLPPLEWYITSVISAILVVSVIVMHIDKNETKSDGDAIDISCDERIFLIMLIDVLWVAITAQLYTDYAFLFFIAIFILNIYAFFGPCEDTACRFFGRSFRLKDVFCVASSLAIFIIQVSLYCGWFAVCLFFIVCAVGAYFLRKSKSGANSWFYWQYVITVFAVLSDIIAYQWFNDSQAYSVIAFVYIIATIALMAINLQNPLHKLSHITSKRVIVIATVIVMLAAVNHFGISCSFDIVNNAKDSASTANEIAVSLKARGKGNSIANCYYYWAANKTKVVYVKPGKNSTVSIPAKNGELYFCITDHYGVKTSSSRWFHDYRTEKSYNCGQVRFTD
jgi:hypothetical protein